MIEGRYKTHRSPPFLLAASRTPTSSRCPRMPDPVARALTKCKNFNELKEPRRGVMLHYDDSSSDAGAVAWFTDPECQVSYNYLVLDDGSYVPIVPEGKRAWHAGVCKTSNSARLPYV